MAVGTHSAPTDAAERREHARAAYEAALDREFGGCSVATLFARSLAAGIEAFRDEDGTLDREEAAAFVVEQTAVTVDFGHLDDEADMSEVLASLEDTFYALGPDGYERLVQLVGWTDALAGYDSSSFAVMTAGTWTVNVVCRNGQLATYESGSDAVNDWYYLEHAGTEAHDPGLRNLRLAAVSRLQGLGPGTWVEGLDDLDPELREMTLTTDSWDDWWKFDLRGDPDELLEEYLDDFAAMLVADGTTDTSDAPVVFRQLIAGRAPATESERQIVWQIWTERRPL